MPRVVIVLSTYNGERFLAEQIESLRRQTFAAWTLLVRDDGSSDETLPLLRRFAAADSRFVVVESETAQLGPTQSFSRLLASARDMGADDVFLCDQDDVWVPDKIERQLRRLHRAVNRFGSDQPLLVHSDLAVVDDRLRPRHDSFLVSQCLRHRSRRALETLAVQNFATGCTMVANRALLDAALPIPPAAVMHDWWLALIAAGAGRVLFDSQPLVLYRQHSQNAVGAKAYWTCIRDAVTRRLSPGGLAPEAMPSQLDAVIRQAEAAAERLADFEPRAGRWLAEFAGLWRAPPSGGRLRALRRLGARRLDPLRHLLLQARLLLATERQR